jgi:DNA-binding CsgD family transcriptional regulator
MSSLAKSALEKFKAIQVLPVSVVVLDPSGKIIGVNDRWKESGQQNGLRLPGSGVGANYLDYCKSGNERFVADLSELLAGRLDLLTLVYPCPSPTEVRWFFLSGVPLSLEKRSGVALLHADLTGLLLLPMAVRKKALTASGNVDVEPAINLDSIGPSVEHSVTEGLSSLLATMLTGNTPSPQHRGAAGMRDSGEVIAGARLSQRQLEILGLLGEGKTNSEIATILSRSPNTIKLHVSAILRQLNFKNRTQAAILASSLSQSKRSRNPA